MKDLSIDEILALNKDKVLFSKGVGINSPAPQQIQLLR